MTERQSLTVETAEFCARVRPSWWFKGEVCLHPAPEPQECACVCVKAESAATQLPAAF